jgi:hypothetical protein
MTWGKTRTLKNFVLRGLNKSARTRVLRPLQKMLANRRSLRLRFDGGCREGAFGAFDARGFALEVAQVVELGAAHIALLQDFDGADRGRIDRENALDADAEAHPADRKRRAVLLAALANHNALERLDAFLFLFAFGRFLQPDVDTDGVTGTKRGDILTSLALVDLLQNAIHVRSPGQTHYGGASAKKQSRVMIRDFGGFA